MSIRNLDFLFRPRSVAVIGASSRAHSIGGALMRNLLDGAYSGTILPVHPRQRSVCGVRAYSDIAELPDTPDLGLICTPPETVPGLVHALGERGARAVAILTGAVHASRSGETLHDAVREAAKAHLLRVLGPNSMGLIVPSLGLNASFAPTKALQGDIAFVSQSGALTAAALDWAAPRNIGFSYVVSLGDAADVDAADALDYLGGDPATHAILLYLESVKQGAKFLSAARAAARAKPVVLLKAGRTAGGAQAAMRHTGCESGSDAVFDAAIRRAGMLRVDTIADLFAAVETLARIRSFRGNRLVVVTNAGGPGVIAVDALESSGGALAALAAETAQRLEPALPERTVPANPLDLGADAGADRYAASLEAILHAPGEDAVLVIHGPSGVVAPREVAEACAAAARDSKRQILACWLGGEQARRSARTLQEAGIAVYATPEAAVRAFLYGVEYRRNQEALMEAPSTSGAQLARDRAAVRALLRQALAAGRDRLTEPEGTAILAAYGIPVVDTFVAATPDEAVKLARQIGFPVALKVLSPDLEHRADVGGVALNLAHEDEVRRAALDIALRMQKLRPEARMAGYTVQRMMRRPGAVHLRHSRHELLLRVAHDSIFGLVVTLCKAGARDPNDAAVGLLPLNQALARQVIEHSSLPGDLLAPAGRAAPDLEALGLALTCLSQLLVDHPEIAGLEIDPLLVDDRGVMALGVDVRVGTPPAERERFAVRPYPEELEEVVELDGGSYLLRPVRPEDASRYVEFIERTEAPDIQLRFFTRVRRLPARDLARYTQIDYAREMAFVAVKREGRQEADICGEVRAFAYPDGATAEFAILVRSDIKGRGLGRALLGKMIAYCRANGVKELIGQIRPHNEAMLALARRCGMQIEAPAEASIAVAHIDLQPEEAAVQAL